MLAQDIERVTLFRDSFLRLMATPIEHDLAGTRRMLISALCSPACLPLVAITPEGKIVGVMIAEAAQSLINEGEWVVGQRVFYVDPVVRGEGVGRHLIRQVERWAKDLGIEWVVMTARHGQVPADWFETQGYAPIEQSLIKRVR